MYKIILIGIILTSLGNKLLCQSKFSLESTIGVQILDYINDDLDTKEAFKSFAAHSSVVFFNETKINEKFESRAGIGYARFDYTTSKDYFTLKYGINYSLSEKIILTIFHSNYFLAFSDIKSDKGTSTVKKYFSNLDLGIRLPLSKKWDLLITSPITLSPMQKGKVRFQPNPIFDLWMENIGLNFGFNYKF